MEISYEKDPYKQLEKLGIPIDNIWPGKLFCTFAIIVVAGAILSWFDRFVFLNEWNPSGFDVISFLNNVLWG